MRLVKPYLTDLCDHVPFLLCTKTEGKLKKAIILKCRPLIWKAKVISMQCWSKEFWKNYECNINETIVNFSVLNKSCFS